jgi:uncharacterized protein (TIGR03086 family)
VIEGRPGDDEIVDRFVRASAFFGEQVSLVRDDDWDRPTPCSDWDVRAVVAHVVVGDAQAVDVLAGHRVSVVTEFDPGVLGTNPLAAWRGTALAAIRAFARPGALGARYDHPVGNVTGRTIIGFRTSDSLVHGWDVATALGIEVVLDPDLCEACLDFWLPKYDSLVSSGYFGPAVMPPDDADPGTRLLALLGRTA